MSVIEHARSELKLSNFDAREGAKIIDRMERFFDDYDSGGAVMAASAMLPDSDAVFKRLVRCLPLTPLTGEPDEWHECGDGVFQNVRCPSVFKDPRFHDGKRAYDIDASERRAAISFPYSPATSAK